MSSSATFCLPRVYPLAYVAAILIRCLKLGRCCHVGCHDAQQSQPAARCAEAQHPSAVRWLVYLRDCRPCVSCITGKEGPWGRQGRTASGETASTAVGRLHHDDRRQAGSPVTGRLSHVHCRSSRASRMAKRTVSTMLCIFLLLTKKLCSRTGTTSSCPSSSSTANTSSPW
jgi:hypothetical protein